MLTYFPSKDINFFKKLRGSKNWYMGVDWFRLKTGLRNLMHSICDILKEKVY